MTETPELPSFFRRHAHDTLSSTNDELRRLAEAGAPEGTCVTARRQSGGRGRDQSTTTDPGAGADNNTF